MRKYFQRTNAEIGPTGSAGLLERLLFSRGIARDAAGEFLAAGEESLNDPLKLSDMALARERVWRAVERGESVCVWGDYDVDGVCASAILSLHLRAMGLNPEIYLPSRHEEGYGLNEAGLRAVANRASLLITVDCGINANPLVALAQSLGMDVIVTDHHRPGETLPDCPVINPLLGDYPCPHLAGAGVAFKLAEALRGRGAAMETIDLAALATVADVVSLTGENRALVRLGLKKINEQPRPGVLALVEAAGLLDRSVTAGHLGFQIGPRLNAGGRLGSAKRSFELLTCLDREKARALAEELDQENTRRREVEKRILDEALGQLAGFDFPARRALILAGEDWNPGVLGLAASRLAENFHYPAILLSGGEVLTGSCRSIEGVDIFAALSAAKEHLTRFGGHRQAAGLTLPRQSLPAFQSALEAYLWENIPAEAYVPASPYDLECSFGELTEPEVAGLERLQPCGMGNPAPVFRCQARVASTRRVGREGAHLKIRLTDGRREIEGMFFQMGALSDELKGEVDALFTPKINAFQGRARVELELKALEPVDAKARILANWDEEAALMSRFLTEMLYNRNIRFPAKPPREACPMEKLEKGPQGILLIAWDFESARDAACRISAPLDVFFGRYPDDPRAFNALAVLPVGDLPRNYREIARIGDAKWLKDLPDVDKLRAIYKAVSPMGESGLQAIAGRAGIGETGCLAGLMALHDMDLVALQWEGGIARARKKPPKRTDPTANPVFQRIQELRTQA